MTPALWIISGIPAGVIAGRLLWGNGPLKHTTGDAVVMGLIGAAGGPITWFVVLIWGACYLFDKDLR